MYPSSLVSRVRSFLRRGRIAGDSEDDDDGPDPASAASSERAISTTDTEDGAGAAVGGIGFAAGPRGIERVLIPRRMVGAWACQPRDEGLDGHPSIALLGSHFGLAPSQSQALRPSRRSGHVAVMVWLFPQPVMIFFAQLWSALISCNSTAAQLHIHMAVHPKSWLHTLSSEFTTHSSHINARIVPYQLH